MLKVSANPVDSEWRIYQDCRGRCRQIFELHLGLKCHGCFVDHLGLTYWNNQKRNLLGLRIICSDRRCDSAASLKIALKLVMTLERAALPRYGVMRLKRIAWGFWSDAKKEEDLFCSLDSHTTYSDLVSDTINFDS